MEARFFFFPGIRKTGFFIHPFIFIHLTQIGILFFFRHQNKIVPIRKAKKNVIWILPWYDMLFFPFIPFRISRGLTNSTADLDESFSSYKCV